MSVAQVGSARDNKQCISSKVEKDKLWKEQRHTSSSD